MKTKMLRSYTGAFTLVFLYLVHCEYTHGKKIEEIVTCANDTECDELIESETYTESIDNGAINVDYSSTSTENVDNTDTVTASTVRSTQTTKSQIISTTTPSPKLALHNNETESRTVEKIKSDMCECDLMPASCDINCCCDDDCNEFQVTSFSRCLNHHVELFDSRYCYNRNFIHRNNTPFILEKLAGNLFCILYDNLPPTNNVDNNLDIKSAKDLDRAIYPKKFTWKWQDQLHVPRYNVSSSYRDGNIVWKMQKNYIQPFELPQSGFNELCNFKKKLRYLRAWKGQCLQTKLANSNEYLFPTAFNNFTVVSSPHLFNESYIKLSDQICPRNVCLALNNYYCQNNWNSCKDAEVFGSCSNGICRDVVTSVKYVIVHNGSMGINGVNVYFTMGNVSRNFYQRFEIVYEWISLDKEKSFARSGNPGYIFGKPIIIGTLKTEKTMNTESRYISFNKTDGFLTLPVAQKNGECNNFDRYVVAFGENVKLKCSTSLSTNNFTSSSCIELQNRTMHLLIQNSLFNISQVEQYSMYVSKLGNFTANSTMNWAQILLDRVPRNVVTAQLINDRLHCSGVVTSMQLNILYSALAKPVTPTNYNILGMGIKFSEEADLSWPKCLIENCTDTFRIDIINYVTFHDLSKPSKYHFVGGPNLDIALPYDFFYPFLSSAEDIKPSIILICIIVVNVVCTIAFNNDIV